MKNYLYPSFFVMAMMLMITACDDKLNLVDPQNADESIVYKTDANVKAALVGTYDVLSRTSLFGGNALRNSELLGADGEIIFSGTYTEPDEMFNKKIISVNTNVADTWSNSYEAISRTNDIINALDVVDEADRDQIKGEVLFIRGLVYFELAEYFGQPYSAGNVGTNEAVPLVLKPYGGLADAEVPRATVKAIYDQVVVDLTDAISLLEAGSDPTRANKEAAQAILARLYLQTENYAGARDLANAVIQAGNFDLMNTYAAVFNGGVTAEDIFTIPVSSTDGTNTMQLYYSAKATGGRGDIEIQQKHLDLYEAGDDRLALFYLDPATADTRAGKWKNPYGNVQVIRLAEMYLTRAECNQRLGTSVGATPLKDINDIRGRAKLGTLGAVDLAIILKERHLELAHEGQRIHDVKRLKGSVTQGATTYAFDDERLVFPIPQRDRNVNKALTQNPGYGEN